MKERERKEGQQEGGVRRKEGGKEGNKGRRKGGRKGKTGREGKGRGGEGSYLAFTRHTWSGFIYDS